MPTRREPRQLRNRLKRARKPTPKAWTSDKALKAVGGDLREGCLNLDPEAIRLMLTNCEAKHAVDKGTYPLLPSSDELVRIPEWLLGAIRELLTRYAKKLPQNKKREKSVASRVRDDQRAVFQFLLVVNLREKGVTPDEIYEVAAEYPFGTPWSDEVGTASGIKGAYERVSKRLGTEPQRYRIAVVESLSYLHTHDWPPPTVGGS